MPKILALCFCLVLCGCSGTSYEEEKAALDALVAERDAKLQESGRKLDEAYRERERIREAESTMDPEEFKQLFEKATEDVAAAERAHAKINAEYGPRIHELSQRVMNAQ